jgi:hypothetical protein
VIGKLATLVGQVMRVPTVSLEELAAIEAKFSRKRRFILGACIVSVCDSPDSEEIALTARAWYGVTSFEIRELSIVAKHLPAESDLPANVLRRDQINLDEEKIFEKYEPPNDDETRDRGLKLLASMGIISHDKPVPLAEEAESVLAKFDELCSLIHIPVRICHVTDSSTSYTTEVPETPRFAQFLKDLGPRFPMGFFDFAFDGGETSNGILVIFNESNRKINTKFGENKALKLIMSVSMCDFGFTKPVRMYRLRIVKVNQGMVVMPFPVNKVRIVTVEHLALMVSAVVYFFCTKCRVDSGSDGAKSELATLLTERVEKREGFLNMMMQKFAVKERIAAKLMGIGEG